jgi:hypothetical protein
LDRIKLRQKPHAFDAQAIERFGRLMRENITSGPIPFRKAYIKSVVDRVEVDDHAIRIVGDEATLEQVVARDQNATPNVRSFVRKWRATSRRATRSNRSRPSLRQSISPDARQVAAAVRGTSLGVAPERWFTGPARGDRSGPASLHCRVRVARHRMMRSRSWLVEPIRRIRSAA